MLPCGEAQPMGARDVPVSSKDKKKGRGKKKKKKKAKAADERPSKEEKVAELRRL